MAVPKVTKFWGPVGVGPLPGRAGFGPAAHAGICERLCKMRRILGTVGLVEALRHGVRKRVPGDSRRVVHRFFGGSGLLGLVVREGGFGKT
jgi:hypothetical protein